MAGAAAAALPVLVVSTFGKVPVVKEFAAVYINNMWGLHWMVEGGAGYAVSMFGEDQCGFLKGIAGGMMMKAVLGDKNTLQ